jgi:hypothetical protein
MKSTYTQVNEQIRNQLRNRLREQLHGEVSEEVRNRVSDHVSGRSFFIFQVRAQVRREIGLVFHIRNIVI